MSDLEQEAAPMCTAARPMTAVAAVFGILATAVAIGLAWVWKTMCPCGSCP